MAPSSDPGGAGGEGGGSTGKYPFGTGPGWYADPESPGQWRWWDGRKWTQHVMQADPEASAAMLGQSPGRPGSNRVLPGYPAPPPEPEVAPALDDRRRERRAGFFRSVRAGGGERPGGGVGKRPGTVVARRWAGLVVAAAIVVAVLVLVLPGHAPALYWQGEPFSNGSQVLARAGSTMTTTAQANEAALSPDSRCYFVLPNRSSHDVGRDLACGPVLFPWSSGNDAWLEYPLRASATSSGVRLSFSGGRSLTTTVALPAGAVLRRPDGAVPPKGKAGLAVPVVPYQRPAWAGLLSAPPAGLSPAPVDDVLGGWAHDYRLVAYGEVNHLSSKYDPAALEDAVDPAGSKWSTGPKSAGGRPLAELLVPAGGQTFVVAELAESPGEASGPVAADANGRSGGSGAGGGNPSLQVTSGTTVASLSVPAGPSTDLYVAASVPVGSRPQLVVSEKGLAQDVSLVNGQPDNVPSVLARLSPNERLDLTGQLPGVTLHVAEASLVWFAGSDGGTVPPSLGDAYLEVMMTATPLSASFLPASDFALRLAGGQVVDGQALADADRTVILIGFVVPASFSTGTVVVSVSGNTFSIPLDLP